LGVLPQKKDHLSLYSRIDIGLDPFPYNGTTTTCEALWMGVPVVALVGDRHAGRVGASILHRIGLAELTATSVGEYIGLAEALARNSHRLQEMRSGLRSRMRSSELMDSRGFTEYLENIYRWMWQSHLKAAAAG
jgi:predicted O-linked N-acetylglucosamine transferase (SPINDLY family)